MGEITEALRRARKRQGSERPLRSPRGEVPQGTPAARAGLASAAPRRVADPAPAAVPLRAEADEDREIVSLSRSCEGSWAARAVLLRPREPYTERFRRFAVRVRDELERREERSVLITSARRSEGKTFTSCNLVLALASMPVAGRIALVELDLRRPAAAAALGISPRVGIEAAIAGLAPIDSARICTDLPSLDLYLVREPKAEAHQILAHQGLAEILRDLARRYDVVIIDSPPVLAVPDVSLLLGHVGACIAVVRAGTSRVRSTHDMLSQLPKNKLMGVFVNDVSVPRGRDKFDYYTVEDDPQ